MTSWSTAARLGVCCAALASPMVFHAGGGQLTLAAVTARLEMLFWFVANAGGEAVVVIKKGQPHGWKEIGDDVETFADWFDTHLLKKSTAPTLLPR